MLDKVKSCISRLSAFAGVSLSLSPDLLDFILWVANREVFIGVHFLCIFWQYSLCTLQVLDYRGFVLIICTNPPSPYVHTEGPEWIVADQHLVGRKYAHLILFSEATSKFNIVFLKNLKWLFAKYPNNPLHSMGTKYGIVSLGCLSPLMPQNLYTQAIKALRHQPHMLICPQD